MRTLYMQVIGTLFIAVSPKAGTFTVPPYKLPACLSVCLPSCMLACLRLSVY